MPDVYPGIQQEYLNDAVTWNLKKQNIYCSYVFQAREPTKLFKSCSLSRNLNNGIAKRIKLCFSLTRWFTQPMADKGGNITQHNILIQVPIKTKYYGITFKPFPLSLAAPKCPKLLLA